MQSVNRRFKPLVQCRSPLSQWYRSQIRQYCLGNNSSIIYSRRLLSLSITEKQRTFGHSPRYRASFGYEDDGDGGSGDLTACDSECGNCGSMAIETVRSMDGGTLSVRMAPALRQP